MLKYRAFEMTLFLFYAENLRRWILGCLKATLPFRPELEAEVFSSPSNGKKLKRALRLLDKEGVVTTSERQEVERLIDYRNKIAHQIHRLTFDIGRSSWTHDLRRFTPSEYDYEALDRLRDLREKISEEMMSRYVGVLEPDDGMFESAAHTYESELQRLKRRIQVLAAERNKREVEVDRELSNEWEEWREWQKGGPFRTGSGKLSDHGVSYCHHLFRKGKSSIVVAYLLKISRSSVQRRRAKWLSAS